MREQKRSATTNMLQLCLSALLLIVVTGCASRPINDDIDIVDPNSGYRPALLIEARENNDPSTFFVLSFSGGGTRAAALSYGVLEELNRYRFPAGGKQRNLIDEIDVITGVSGGSFTALSYALYGERLFEEYEERFLKRNVQGALTKRFFLNPANWFRMMSGNYGRSEIAADYYDKILFEHATFNDLAQAGGPFAIAVGTALSTGARLAFFQNEFDLLCSDLGTVNLSRAAATSSAVPAVLSPVTFDNYGGNCNYQYPPWVEDTLNPPAGTEPSARALARYKEMQALQNSKEHPYLHLVDGGIGDNLGVRGVLEAMEEMQFSRAFRQEHDLASVRQIVLIVVNAEANEPNNWNKNENPPNTLQQTMQSSGVPMSHYTFETVELMRSMVREADWQRQLRTAKAQLAGASKEEAEARFPKIELLVFDVSFDAIKDDEERLYFKKLPTSFVLEDEEVDRLREVGGRLLRQAPIYQEVIDQIGAERLE